MKKILLLIMLVLLPLSPLGARGKDKGNLNSFRYEIYSEGQSAVFYAHQRDSLMSLYYRLPGSSEGWYLSSVNPAIMEGLSAICKEFKLHKHTLTDLKHEDKSKDRRIIELGYTTGPAKPMIDYISVKESLDEKILSFFTEFLGPKQAEAYTCSKTKLEYDAEGKIIRKTIYEY